MPSQTCKVCGKPLTPARLRRAMKEGYKCRACCKHRRPIPGSYNAPQPPLSPAQIVQVCKQVISRGDEYQRWRSLLTQSLVFLPQPWSRLPYGEAESWRVRKEEVFAVAQVNPHDYMTVARMQPLFQEVGLIDADYMGYDYFKGCRIARPGSPCSPKLAGCRIINNSSPLDAQS